MENRARSLAKAITFRIVATSITVLLTFLFTKSLAISVTLGSLEFLLKVFFYYLHERIWNILSFGRKNSAVDKTARTALLKNAPVASPEDDGDQAKV
jgi:uncharacterized membrane protein